ncbi:DUF1801 domain-containing protein [Micrococcoides hystricis]|uniref:DUF1801 domain-containing protein n=1 Tax=Micrococcoides hystricis TaxID=1572761 RepID=A0ABV6PCT9_9MICC
MATANKTQPTDVDPREFIAAVEHPVRRADAEVLLELMHKVTGEEPVMWGPSIIGFGSYHYKYASGREGDAPAVGFSPRKASQSLYVLADYPGIDELLSQLGKHKRSVACLYVNKLADIDLDVLTEMTKRCYNYTLAELDQT